MEFGQNKDAVDGIEGHRDLMNRKTAKIVRIHNGGNTQCIGVVVGKHVYDEFDVFVVLVEEKQSQNQTSSGGGKTEIL